MTKTVRLYCENGKHEWERPSQRGKRPKSCPQHSNAALISAPPKKSKEELAEIRREAGKKGGATRAAKIAEKQAQDQAQREASIAKAIESLPSLSAKWERAMDKAAKATKPEDIRAAFNEADNLQARILNIRNSQRSLARAS